MVEPFDMFGEDDDDEGDIGGDESGTESMAASILVQSANIKIAAAQTTGQVVDEEAHSAPTVEESESNALEKIENCHISWSKPLYLGPMILSSSLPVGGGRGYVASQRLSPGTLVLVEDPIFKWPEDEIGKRLSLEMVKHIIEADNANELIRDMEEFHPTKEQVDNLDNDDTDEGRIQISDMMNLIRSSNLDEEWADVVGFARIKNVRSCNGAELTQTDLVRLMVALRYNGLETGLYRHVAMLNHKCHPNCVKMRPSEASYSEVRTTRWVEAGEALTISYLPRIVCHASRRKLLWEQHRFDIGANLKDKHLFVELVDNKLPSSSINKWDEETLTHRIETATEELENFYQETLANVVDGKRDSQAWEYVKALEVSALELYNESVSQLKNDRHVILIPILTLHLNVCDLVQKASLPSLIHLKVLTRSVVTARCLLSLQEDFLGSDHFDLARTSLDLAESIKEILSKAPKQLVDLNIAALSNFGAWSGYENQLRKQHDRIRLLYPYDTSNYIGNKAEDSK